MSSKSNPPRLLALSSDPEIIIHETDILSLPLRYQRIISDFKEIAVAIAKQAKQKTPIYEFYDLPDDHTRMREMLEKSVLGQQLLAHGGERAIPVLMAYAKNKTSILGCYDTVEDGIVVVNSGDVENAITEGHELAHSKFLKIQGPRNDYKDKGTLAGPAYGILNEATALASDHIVKRQIENALISPKKVPLSREEIYREARQIFVNVTTDEAEARSCVGDYLVDNKLAYPQPNALVYVEREFGANFVDRAIAIWSNG